MFVILRVTLRVLMYMGIENIHLFIKDLYVVPCMMMIIYMDDEN